MKNFSANLLAFVLVGTLSIAEAQRGNSKLDRIFQMLVAQSVGPRPGLESVVIFGDQAEEAKRILKEKCKKNGGSTAFQKLTAAQQDFRFCLIVDIQPNFGVKATPTPEAAAREVSEQICRSFPNALKCARTLADKVGVCLDSVERKNLAILNNKRSSLFDFLCRDESDRFATFLDRSDGACIPSKQKAIDACLEQSVANLTSVVDSTSRTQGLPNLQPIVWSSQERALMSTIQKCTVEVLKQCDDPKPAEFIDNVFDFAKKINSAAAANCFNSLVLTIVTAIFLKFV